MSSNKAVSEPPSGATADSKVFMIIGIAVSSVVIALIISGAFYFFFCRRCTSVKRPALVPQMLPMLDFEKSNPRNMIAIHEDR
jgi:hypothetical protein